MVQTLQTNSNNDLFLNSSNSLTMLTNVAAVAAACTSAAQTQLGECVLQTGYGLPNFQAIWVGVPDFAIWEAYLENILLGVEGVASIESVSILQNGNDLNYSAQINTIYGPTTINGVLNG